MTRPPLTDRQASILGYITRRYANGRPATVREIAADFGIKTTNGVMCHIKSLQQKGYIKNYGHARGFEPTDDPIAILVREAYKAMNTFLQHGLSAAALEEALKHFSWKGLSDGDEAGEVHRR